MERNERKSGQNQISKAEEVTLIRFYTPTHGWTYGQTYPNTHTHTLTQTHQGKGNEKIGITKVEERSEEID